MVRGGPANRAIKRAKIFALTKVHRITRRLQSAFNLSVTFRVSYLDALTGVPRESQELLQFGCSCRAQSLTVRIQGQTVEEEGHEICELTGEKVARVH